MSDLIDDCIFCKIIRQDIPCHKIYEDSNYLSFLDINPIDEGHSILIPKIHTLNLFELPDCYATGLGKTISLLGKRIMNATGATGLNVLSNIGRRAGQIVMHTHIHLIPRYEGDSQIDWVPKECNHSDLANLAKRITEAR